MAAQISHFGSDSNFWDLAGCARLDEVCLAANSVLSFPPKKYSRPFYQITYTKLGLQRIPSSGIITFMFQNCL